MAGGETCLPFFNMNDTAYNYSEALLPNTYTICGVVLKPFCLGHLIILEHFQNPLVAPSEMDVSFSEGIYWLFQAILICSLSYEDNLLILDDDAEYQKLANKFCDNLLKVMEKDPEWNFLKSLNMFKAYLKYFMNMPLYTEENTKAETPSGIDWKNCIFLIFKKLGYDETQILNMNMKKLFFEWCSYAESEGALKVWNRHDVEAYKKLKGLN